MYQIITMNCNYTKTFTSLINPLFLITGPLTNLPCIIHLMRSGQESGKYCAQSLTKLSYYSRF